MKRLSMMQSLFALVAGMMGDRNPNAEHEDHRIASAVASGGWGGPAPTGSVPNGAYFRRSPKKKAKWCRNRSFKGGRR